MPKRGISRNRLVTQLSQVSGQLEHLFYYPEGEPYYHIFEAMQGVLRALAEYILAEDRAVELGEDIEESLGTESGRLSDFSGQQSYAARSQMEGASL